MEPPHAAVGAAPASARPAPIGDCSPAAAAGMQTLLNQAGAVVGGGRGSSTGSLPAHARQFVKITSDVDNVPASDAVQALITVVPRYKT